MLNLAKCLPIPIGSFIDEREFINNLGGFMTTGRSIIAGWIKCAEPGFVPSRGRVKSAVFITITRGCWAEADDDCKTLLFAAVDIAA